MDVPICSIVHAAVQYELILLATALSVRVLLATITPACIRIVAGNCSQQSAISRRSQGDTAHHCQHLHQPTAYYSFCRCHFNRAGHF